MMPTSAVVTCGGDVSSVLSLDRYARHVDRLSRSQDLVVVAADQGWHLARTLDLDVDHLVGDFDSLADDQRRRAEAAGVEVHESPRRKNHTDLDLALGLAHELGAREVVVCDGGGTRADHALANVLTVAGWGGRMVATVATTAATTTVITSARGLDGEVGSYVSLLPVFGPVHDIVTTGLLYPLSGETLSPGSSRGVSNELVAPNARVSIGSGTLLAVQPGT